VHRQAYWIVIGIVALILSACSSPPPAESFPCDVARVLESRCHRCHSDPPALGVPFPLMTFADTRRTTTLTRSGAEAPIWQVMGEVLEDRKMPLDPDTGNPAPMSDNDPDRLILLSWIRNGARASVSVKSGACDSHFGS
jgi:hypothetical protein